MRTHVLVVASPARSPRLECTGGLAARRTGPDTVHLVSAAATPLGGDLITVRIVVEPGARLRIRSAAATLVLPGPGTLESVTHWDIDNAGDLDVDPQPTVVAGASRHLATTRVQLTRTAGLRLRERVQIGRTGERQGFWSGMLHADLDGAPMLRHRIELGDDTVADDVLEAPRATVSVLSYPAPSPDAAGTALELASGGWLTTWQGERLTN